MTRLNTAGSALVFSTYLGGNGDDAGQGIAVDPATGDALVTGFTGSTNFPTANPLYASNGGERDVFVTRLNAAGSALVFSTYLGGNGFDEGYGIAVDPATGDALVTGFTQSPNFPTANPFQPTIGGVCNPLCNPDAYVARLRSDGAALVFSTYLGGSGDDRGSALAVDPASGDALVTGRTWSTNFPTANPLFVPGFFRSTNAAATWSRRNGAGLQSLALSSLRVDPGNPATLYAVSFGSVVKSTDGGDTWSPSGNGLGNQTVTYLLIDPITSSTLYAGMASFPVVFKSTDSGASWAPSGTGLADPRVTSLALDPTMPAVLYAGAETFRTCGPLPCPVNRVYKSTNGGLNWTLSNTGIPDVNNVINALGVDPISPATVYAATRFGGVYKSTNGGGTWALSNTGLPGEARLLTIAPPVPTSLQTAAKTTTLYAVAQNRVYKSTNAGGTWTLSSTGLPTANISALVASPAGEPALYVGTSAGLYKSTNAGGSWARADAGVTNPNVTALALAPSSPATLYASAATSGSDAFVARISP